MTSAFTADVLMTWASSANVSSQPSLPFRATSRQAADSMGSHWTSLAHQDTGMNANRAWQACGAISLKTLPRISTANDFARPGFSLVRFIDHGDDQSLTECCKGSLHLIELRPMFHMEDAVYLWQMPLEPLREFGFADITGAHRSI